MEPGAAKEPGGPPASGQALGQLRRGVLEYCVMAMLRGAPLYSVDVVHRLAHNHGMKVSEGTIYPLLTRLRKEGRVETSWQEGPTGPPRRYYALTPEGHQALASFITDWKAFTASVTALFETEETP